MKYIAVVLILALYLISCTQPESAPLPADSDATPSNHNPVIESVTYTQDLSSLDSTEIICQASDEDGDPLKYIWAAETGEFKGSGSTVTWTAPDNEGNYAITAKVSDGKGGTDSKSIIVQVRAKTEEEGESDLAKISLEQSLANGKATLAEFGWRICIPCKAMKPILEELAVEYSDRLNVLIVEVYDPAQEKLVTKYGINAIPTQIFFSSAGKEMYRHEGFISKADILIQLKKIGVR